MASIFKYFPILRRAAPRLSREFFTCQACGKASPPPGFRPQFKSVRRTPFFQAFRSQTTQAPKHAVDNTTSPLGALSSTISVESAANRAKPRSNSFPEISDKAVAYWLLGSAASVFGIVVFGGLTRLTESGLSITEWRPVTGSLPPMSTEDWEAEFTKYRSSPEFALLNPNMTLPEFKQIFWMEWGHRLWGRIIGVTFVLPTIYSIARRRVSVPMAWKLVGICGLIGFQGAIGWWMVKSGLHDDLFAPGSHPRVSQYRLATHLGAAFIVYATMLLSGLSIIREHSLLANPEAAQKIFATLKHPHLRVFRRSVTALSILVFITAMSGALVAGLDAGLIYNEFPYMGVGLTPPKKELFDPFYSHVSDQSDLWWRNMLENPSLVQLDHRILAMSTFTAVISLFAYSRYSSRVRAILPANARKGIMGTVHLVWMQAALGISTLIYLVPTWLAATHQAGSLALLTGVLVLGSRLSMPRRAVKLVQQAVKSQPSGVSGSRKRGVGLGIRGIEQKRA